MITPLPPTLLDARLAPSADRLARRYAGRFAPETIHRLLVDSYDRLARTAVIETYLFSLAERFTRERLDALREAGVIPEGVVRVLFVCGRNAGRSQMAAALLEHRANGRAVAFSAGTDPAGTVTPEIAQILAEADVPVLEAYPKPLTAEIVRTADVVVTMGCGDACPVSPGRRYLDWPLPDPEGAPLRMVRALRDDIDVRVTGLLALLSTA